MENFIYGLLLGLLIGFFAGLIVYRIYKKKKKKEPKKEPADKEKEVFKFQTNPLDKIEITQKFGFTKFSKRTGKYNGGGHPGLDFQTIFNDSPDGKRKVFAVMDGVALESVKNHRWNGNYIRLEHTDKSRTVYCHFDSLSVNKNQKVKAGDILGITDNTGESTGPHLHFGYRPPVYDINDGYKGYSDPESYLI